MLLCSWSLAMLQNYYQFNATFFGIKAFIPLHCLLAKGEKN